LAVSNRAGLQPLNTDRLLVADIAWKRMSTNRRSSTICLFACGEAALRRVVGGILKIRQEQQQSAQRQ